MVHTMHTVTQRIYSDTQFSYASFPCDFVISELSINVINFSKIL